MEGDPVKIDRTHINSNEREVTSISVNSRTFPCISVNFRKSPYVSVNPRKLPYLSVYPRKSPYIPVNPRNGTVGVLTDRPPGTPSPIVLTQDDVNTVGPVPMTFGYGPNTFPHSAAYVLNTNHSPSRSEGEPINKIYTSAAMSQNLSGVPKYFKSSNTNESKTSHFTGSTFNVVPNFNKDVSKIPSFTIIWNKKG